MGWNQAEVYEWTLMIIYFVFLIVAVTIFVGHLPLAERVELFLTWYLAMKGVGGDITGNDNLRQ